MSLPAPRPGLVIRYGYLWASDGEHGHEHAAKERPAVVVMALQLQRSDAVKVFALPITHSAPPPETEALEIPVAVARSAGLDSARCWVILSEFNEFLWPGFDLGLVPGRLPKTVAYGFLPPRFFDVLKSRWLALDLKQKSVPVSRDEA